MERLHPKAAWLFFFRAFFASLFIAIFLFFFAFLFEIGNYIPTGTVAIIFLLAVVIFSYVWAQLTYHFWRYQLGERAIKIEKGIIWKKYISIPYGRIQNVDIYRGVLARLLGLSDLQIQTAGYSTYKQ